MKGNVPFLSHLHPVKLSTLMAPYSFVNLPFKIQKQSFKILAKSSGGSLK
jgi:hypothetical protein